MLLNILQQKNANLAIGLPPIFTGFPELEKGAISFWSDRDHYRRFLLRYVSSNLQYMNTQITSPYHSTLGTSCTLLDQTFHYLRKIWNGKDIVLVRGNNDESYQFDVYDTARSQTIIFAPRRNAYASYQMLEEQLMSYPSTYLFILAAGPVSRALCFALFQNGRRALDLGHLAKDYDCFCRQSPNKTFYSV